MFPLWPLGCYGDILGQNHKILLKNHRILEKMYHPFIFTCILNPSESSYDKCHSLLFLMAQYGLCILLVILGQKLHLFDENL
jgi:hypothetical protein